MKKFISALIILFVTAISANAMSYEQAREQALFLTDKMAYELNLSEEQYEAAYEINLDYLMSIRTQDDLFGIYWRQRTLDMSYILLDWQYNTFCSALYFYRPLYWSAGYWRFRIYARYPRRDYFYFGCPHFVVVYKGGHSWRHNGGHSWYKRHDFRPKPGVTHFGMRDGFKRGDYGKGHTDIFGNRKNGNKPLVTSRPNNNGGSFGKRPSGITNKKDVPSINASSFGGMRGGTVKKAEQKPRNTFTPRNGNLSTDRTVKNKSSFSRSGRLGGSASNNRDLINNIRNKSPRSTGNTTRSFGGNRAKSSTSLSRSSNRSSFSAPKSSPRTNRSTASPSRGGGKFGGRR